MPAEEATPFTDAELEVLGTHAYEPVLAGLAHRFEEPIDLEHDSTGPAFLGRVLAAALLKAQLAILEGEVGIIKRRTTSTRKRVRLLTGDPYQGQLDVSRLGAVVPELQLWPV